MTIEDFVRRGQAAQVAVDAMTVSTELRAWLRRRREPPEVQASALVYELAALIARQSETVPQAQALIDHWATTMKHQVHHLGVDAEHP